MGRSSLLDYFGDFARHGTECAYVYPRGYRHERWSYRQVAEAAYQFARELQERQIAQGDAIILWSQNCAEWAAAFWGCALCGVIAVPIDYGASADFARRISAQVNTKLVICPRERATVFEAIPSIDPVDLVPVIVRHPADPFLPVEIQP